MKSSEKPELSQTIKIHDQVHIRPIGTPYIEKRPIEIKLIKPANQNMSYTLIFKSPLETNFEELQDYDIKGSSNFFTSIKPPKIEPRDIYNKVILE